MIGGNKIKDENRLSSIYLQGMDLNAPTNGSDSGANPMSVTYEHNIPVTSENLVFDLNQLYTEKNLLPDLNTIDMSSDMSNVYGQGFCYPEWNINELPLNSHETVVSDSLMSEQNNNILYDKSAKDISIQNNGEHSSVERDFPSKIDGGFLSLGIGDSTENKSEICFNWDGGIGEPLDCFDRFSNVQNEAAPSTSFYDYTGSVYSSHTYPGSSQFHTLQETLPDMPREYPTYSIANPEILNFGDNLDANWDNVKQFSSGSSFGLSDIENIYKYYGLDSVRHNLANTQPISDRLEKRYIQRTKSFSLESSTVTSATGARGSSITQENTGQVAAFTSLAAQAAIKSGQPLKRKLVQPDGSIYGVNAKFAKFGAETAQFPYSTRVQASDASVLHPTGGCSGSNTAALIPNHHSEPSSITELSQASDVQGGSSRKRSAKQPPAPRVQRKKKIIPPPVISSISPTPPAAPRVQQKTKAVRSPPSIAPAAASTVQIKSVTALPPSLPSVQYPPSVAPASAAASTVQIKNVTALPSSVPSVPSVPSVKYPPSLAPVRLSVPEDPTAQIPKIKVPSPVLNIPPVAPVPPVPAPPLHIRWQDPDAFPPPLGEKCMICKRDLLFTAEGPVSQPDFPPEAAVLPCGHTFHDFCLKNITPQDQATNPPCIPCALGEI